MPKLNTKAPQQKTQEKRIKLLLAVHPTISDRAVVRELRQRYGCGVKHETVAKVRKALTSKKTRPPTKEQIADFAVLVATSPKQTKSQGAAPAESVFEQVSTQPHVEAPAPDQAIVRVPVVLATKADESGYHTRLAIGIVLVLLAVAGGVGAFFL
jgi:hypothetical protein